MIVRIRFRDSVTVQGFGGEWLSLSNEQVEMIDLGDKLLIGLKGKPLLVDHQVMDGGTTTKVPMSNVLWIHEAPDTAPKPEKKPKKPKP